MYARMYYIKKIYICIRWPWENPYNMHPINTFHLGGQQRKKIKTGTAESFR